MNDDENVKMYSEIMLDIDRLQRDVELDLISKQESIAKRGLKFVVASRDTQQITYCSSYSGVISISPIINFDDSCMSLIATPEELRKLIHKYRIQ